MLDRMEAKADRDATATMDIASLPDNTTAERVPRLGDAGRSATPKCASIRTARPPLMMVGIRSRRMAAIDRAWTLR